MNAEIIQFPQERVRPAAGLKYGELVAFPRSPENTTIKDFQDELRDRMTNILRLGGKVDFFEEAKLIKTYHRVEYGKDEFVRAEDAIEAAYKVLSEYGFNTREIELSKKAKMTPLMIEVNTFTSNIRSNLELNGQY